MLGGTCIRVKIVSALVVLILFSPMFITDGYETNLFYDQKLVVDVGDHDQDVFENAEQLLMNAPRAFTSNYGQLENAEVLFYDQGGAVWFSAEGVWFELREYAEPRVQGSQLRGQILQTHIPTNSPTQTQKYKRAILKQEFIGANKVKPIGKERLSWNSNFFYGNISENWCTDVPNYAEVWYENVYDGIDLRYYSNENGLKYDFIVHPGADPNQILLKYNGTTGLSISYMGDLIINTKIKDIKDSNLFIYQIYDQFKYQINGRFLKYNDQVFGFELLDEYDRNKDLVIDPVIDLNFSTFIGGNGVEFGFDMAVDIADQIYITGYTDSTDFPTTPGAFNTTQPFINTDCYVLKINQNGTSLIYSTFIGSCGHDASYAIAINGNGEAIITGVTAYDFPTTPGAFNRTNIGAYDAFALRLSSNGSKLIYSTFIGGEGQDIGFDLVIDTNNNVYITGYTDSSDFPTTYGAYNTTYMSGLNGDVFVLKLNPNGSALIYSTFVGGLDYEQSSGIKIDKLGNAYVSGGTGSTDFPTTSGAIYNIYNGGFFDGFVFKINHNGSTLIYSTFVGGNGSETVNGIAIGEEGDIYLTGHTNSSDFPVTSGAFDTSFNDGDFSEAFVMKMNHNFSSFYYSTFLGGASGESGVDINVDIYCNVYVLGETTSADFPTTKNAFDRSHNGNITNNTDCFFSMLNCNGSKLLYSTLLGGNNRDDVYSLALDTQCNAYITGTTFSSNFPVTSNTFDTTHGGFSDVFITKFDFSPIINISSINLFKDLEQTNITYSRLCKYTFQVNILDSAGFDDINNVILTIMTNSGDLKLQWNQSSGQFTELEDPNDYIKLESSNFISYGYYLRTINFNLTFNWTYPDENLQSVRVQANSIRISPTWLNCIGLFRVENDLTFKDTLTVVDDNDRIITNQSLVCGCEQLFWTGLIPVYENTTDIYPPSDEIDVTIWDENSNHWLGSPEPGHPINITTITPNKTTSSFNYTINLTGIPPECDKTDQKFKIRIDADNVTFSNPWPGKDIWQKNSEVFTGVTISDHGGGVVDIESIMHSISGDNGTTWSGWKKTEFAGESESITVYDFASITDGDDNFIKWCAKDSLGNGPAESKPCRILVDTQPVFFVNPIPLPIQESSNGEVEIGITIIDNTSGVNASTIKYSISTDGGNDWSSWKTVTSLQNGNNVDIKLNQTFQNGTGNHIRWRAYDIAGNGPTYSGVYAINVNIPPPPVIILPKNQLLLPTNNSKLITTAVILSWEVINDYHPDIVFDIKMDTTTPPQDIIKQNYTDSIILIKDLVCGQTYYWTVIPRLDNLNGSCQSGIWSFTVILPLPKVTLLTPGNGSVITSTRPTLTWVLEYTGLSIVEYNIYFGTDMDPDIYQNNIATKYFSIDFILKDNTIYYWYIEPWVDGLRGYQSSIWSFTVKSKQDNNIPEFGIELDIDPNPLEIKPGELETVSAIVTNLGELNDNFTVFIGDINSTELIAKVYWKDTMEIAPRKKKEFSIIINVKEGTAPGYGNITIRARSKLAEGYGLEVQDSQVLTIKILKKDENKERGQPINIFYFSILLLIIFLIIIFIIILILIRKKTSKKEIKEQNNQEVITEASVESTNPPEPEPFVEPIPPVPVPVQTLQRDETLEE